MPATDQTLMPLDLNDKPFSRDHYDAELEAVEVELAHDYASTPDLGGLHDADAPLARLHTTLRYKPKDIR